MLSVFKQLVHVAIASASLLHFPVSERQMNGNDCFVLLFSRLYKLHKTYISSFPSAIFCVCREQKEKERWRHLNQESLRKCRRSFFVVLFFNCEAVLLSFCCFLS